MTGKIYVSEKGANNAKKQLHNAEIQEIPAESEVVCYGSTVKIKELHEGNDGSSRYISLVNIEDQNFLNEAEAKFQDPHNYATIGSALANAVVGRKVGNLSTLNLPNKKPVTILVEEVNIIQYLIPDNQKKK